ncbi:hypothetical protein G7Y89_g3790 [Cudoniella acicularis]|uniref:C3H1-type domain-containing protein n=1 Tax=Cudoniella acicularis TaxID=354080 RepID=A0A8H4W5L6_9HELO|nr:hypothetical protein G7Y89_g3790 [Cudoniella acicularis]
MTLSANASRALEQVKMGLFVLYGADYFTEDEWIKIDGLIHKGQYVFTRGPPTNFLEEELMSFDDAKDTGRSLDLQTEPMDTFELINKVPSKSPDADVPSSISDLAGSTDSPGETENLTSAETSSNGETAVKLEAKSDEKSNEKSDEKLQEQPQAKEEPLFDFSDMPQSTSTEAVEPPKPGAKTIPSAGGLALGYTQAQLDEVKAFNAGLTRAGKKSRPNYKQKESYSSAASSVGDRYHDEEENNVKQQPLQQQPLEQSMIEQQKQNSPVATEKADRIHSWASEVNSSVSKVQSRPQNSSWNSPVPDDPRRILVEEFIKSHGCVPKSVNDIYQPKNPGFTPGPKPPKRPVSRASNTKSLKKAIPSATVNSGKLFTPELNVTSGTILIAQSDARGGHPPRIEVAAGDQVKVLKHVSGDLHYGVNLRTNAAGQFEDSIFRKPSSDAAQLIQHQQNLAAQRARAPSVSTTYSTGLDRVERINAAEWDDVPMVSRPRRAQPAPTRPVGGGLATSRFAVLSDEGERESVSEKQEFVHGVTREQVDKLVEEKFEQILKAQKQNTTTNPSRPSTGPRTRSLAKDPLLPTPPKSVTCWFWATPNKECRFTAEECRDLHAFVANSSVEPPNLRAGKPTWGALADVLLPTPVSPSPATFDKIEASRKAQLTCHFWAQEGKCHFKDEECKYLHGWGANGVAPAPKHWVAQKHGSDWSLWDIKKEGSSWDLASKKADGGAENGTPPDWDTGTGAGAGAGAGTGAADWGDFRLGQWKYRCRLGHKQLGRDWLGCRGKETGRGTRKDRPRRSQERG